MNEAAVLHWMPRGFPLIHPCTLPRMRSARGGGGAGHHIAAHMPHEQGTAAGLVFHKSEKAGGSIGLTHIRFPEFPGATNAFARLVPQAALPPSHAKAAFLCEAFAGEIVAGPRRRATLPAAADERAAAVRRVLGRDRAIRAARVRLAVVARVAARVALASGGLHQHRAERQEGGVQKAHAHAGDHVTRVNLCVPMYTWQRQRTAGSWWYCA
jgi:hypothetical protein